MSLIAATPETPYYAVIFTSNRTEIDDGYSESARDEVGITVSYWSDLESIKRWKMNVDHQAAQRLGHEKWYSSFRTRIALVEREYGF